jgi:two-component system chemotaxis response regulator CheY
MTKRVLTVDDSKTMRDMVTFTLKGGGYDTFEAIDGADAIEALGNRPVDLIITDLNMPRIDGFGLIEALRSTPTYKFTPILILTTESEAQKKDRGKAVGATGWIVKPFNPDKLLQIVRKVCP